jgi:hypothetical protein
MINKNKYQLMCFLLINSMFPLEKQVWAGQTCCLKITFHENFKIPHPTQIRNQQLMIYKIEQIGIHKTYKKLTNQKMYM